MKLRDLVGINGTATGRRRFVASLVGWLALLLAWGTRGQNMVVDPTFQPAITTPQNAALWSVVLQRDGRAILGGDFEFFHGCPFNSLVGLRASGEVDPAFQPWPGVRGAVKCVTLQPDGKLVIGGGFDEVGGQPRHKIARLNPDGSLDAQFEALLSGNDPFEVSVARIQPDGMLLIGGSFKSVGARPRSGVARLKIDGRVDEGFDPGAGAEDSFAMIRDLALQTDGSVVVAGAFTKFDGWERPGLVRLGPDGIVDASFAVDLQWTLGLAAVNAVCLQPAGEVVIAGQFDSINGVLRNGMARLHPDGTLDESFDPGAGASGGSAALVYALALLGDGRMVIGGDFERVGDAPRAGLARLNPDGSVDPAFVPNPGLQNLDGTSGTARALAALPDGGVIAIGAFARVNGIPRHELACLQPDGSLNGAFSSADQLVEKVGTVNTMLVQDDGRCILGGQFDRVDGLTRHGLARLWPDGALDLAFDPDLGPDGAANALVAQRDGRVVIGGEFSTLGGVGRVNIARIESGGALDFSFDPGAGIDGPVYCLALQPDGQVLVGGAFDLVDTVAALSIARLGPDGQVDATYNPLLAHSVGSPEVYALAAQPDGNALVGGFFNRVNGQWREGLVRLQPDGTIEPTFNATLDLTGGWPFVLALGRQVDGKIIAGGAFDTVDGATRNDVVRLNPDGSLDAAFDPGLGVAGSEMAAAYAVLARTNGTVVVAGDFSSYNGMTQNNLALLSPNGSLDAASPVGQVTDALVDAVAGGSGDSLLIGGAFTSADHKPRQALALFTTHPPKLPRLNVRSDGNATVIDWDGPGQLQIADAVAGVWQNVPGAVAPYRMILSGRMQFFRLLQPPLPPR